MEVSSVGSSSTELNQISSPDRVLGKDDFLQMLVTQLKFQDPLNPMDNTAFVAQLAEFSALEQMQNVNSTLQSTMMLNQSLNNTLITELIGKSVRALGDGLYLPSSGEVDLKYSLSQDAADVKIQILSREGVAVRTLELGAQSSGEQVIRWDGKDATGTPLDSGVYAYVLQAVDMSGQEVPGRWNGWNCMLSLLK